MQIGSSLLAVDDEQVLAIVEYVEPTPLPFAPPAVLGIVSIEGKMFTVLETAGAAEIRKQLLALRGDEQLAIAIDGCDAPREIEAKMIYQPESDGSVFSQARFRDGQRDIPLLEVSKLFSGILQGRERRRRRL
jgi:chemotaxis signal transduction protein